MNKEWSGSGKRISEYITIVALVILCRIPHICITPLLGSVAGGECEFESFDICVSRSASVNMRPESLYKHIPFLNFLYYIGPGQFEKLFMTDAQVLVIAEIVENILLGNLSLSGTQLGNYVNSRRCYDP